MTSKYGAYPLLAGYASLQARTCMRTPTRPGTQARTRTQTHKYVIVIVIPRQQWFRERLQCYVIRILHFLFTHGAD